MAKRIKATDGKEATGVEAIRGNGYDSEVTQEFVDRIEEVQSEVDAIMQKAKDASAPLREDIDGIKTEANDAGLPRKELNAIISKRRALKRAEMIRERLSEEQQANFDQLELALGMLPDSQSRKSANGESATATVN